MFKVDPDLMQIYITRGDSAGIIFSAEDEEGEEFHPTEGDKLIFGAAKKVGDEPLIRIENTMVSNEEDFWLIHFSPEDTKDLSFGKYAFDVEIQIWESGAMVEKDTIIGKTDILSPTLTIWGEVV